MTVQVRFVIQTASAVTWRTGNMSVTLAVALLCLVLFCLLMFLWVHVVLPKINVNKIVNTELTDSLAEKIFCVLATGFLALFMLLFYITDNVLLMVISQLITIKLMTGFEYYLRWVEESNNKHLWRRFILSLFFYIIPKK